MVKKKVAALIPLRGGSKSIPKKNIKLIAGKPLCSWVLEAACDAIGEQNVYVSTEDMEIKKVVKNINKGINIIERPTALATDTASTESVMMHFMSIVSFDVLVTLQVTSPLTTPTDIKKALELFVHKEFDSMVTGVSTKRFFWKSDGTPVNYDPLHRPLRQNIEGWIMENGAFYITKRNVLEKYKCRLGGKIGLFEMNHKMAIEIDEREDWKIVESYLMERRKKEVRTILKKIKLVAIDVDGTLTDAGMYYSAAGEELKKFNTHDGQGLFFLMENGIDVAIITAEKTQIVAARARKLNIARCHMGVKNKIFCLKEICRDSGVELSEAVYIGDDKNDMECMKVVGFSACPVDAVDVIKNIVTYICHNKGGNGAVREVCDMIISSRQYDVKSSS